MEFTRLVSWFLNIITSPISNCQLFGVINELMLYISGNLNYISLEYLLFIDYYSVLLRFH